MSVLDKPMRRALDRATSALETLVGGRPGHTQWPSLMFRRSAQTLFLEPSSTTGNALVFVTTTRIASEEASLFWLLPAPIGSHSNVQRPCVNPVICFDRAGVQRARGRAQSTSTAPYYWTELLHLDFVPATCFSESPHGVVVLCEQAALSNVSWWKLFSGLLRDSWLRRVFFVGGEQWMHSDSDQRRMLATIDRLSGRCNLVFLTNTLPTLVHKQFRRLSATILVQAGPCSRLPLRIVSRIAAQVVRDETKFLAVLKRSIVVCATEADCSELVAGLRSPGTEYFCHYPPP